MKKRKKTAKFPTPTEWRQMKEEIKKQREEMERDAAINQASKQASPMNPCIQAIVHPIDLLKRYQTDKCPDCHHRICLVPVDENDFVVYEADRWGTPLGEHVCDGTSAANDAPVGISGGGFETNRRRH